MPAPLTEKISDLPLPVIDPIRQPTVADRVFDALHARILSLDLPPRTKLSEAEVARQMGVSRQPVREAFKRLSQLGFLEIRPQSGTRVTLISEESVHRARFVRTALEAKTMRTACACWTGDDLAPLEDLIDRQRAAVQADDRNTFHRHDDAFHRAICEIAGVGFVWDLINESKSHMDRIRMLSLDNSSQRMALAEHIELLTALKTRDGDRAEAVINTHLSRILGLVAEIKAQDHRWFQDAAG